MDFKCIVCDNDIKQLDKPLPASKSWQGMYSDGIVDVISAGYGSKLDGDMFVIAICDKCINKKTLEGKAHFVGDYMMNQEPEINKYEYYPLKDD